MRQCKQLTILIMKYSEEFKALLDYMPDGYIGHGNPNAKILFIGQEPAIDRNRALEQYDIEIAHNAKQWRKLVSKGIGYETINHSEIEYGLPLHPWANQKYQVRSGSEEKENLKGAGGTSKTWYNYQKLINRIFELYSTSREPMTKDDYLDFHELSFHTDMSDVAYKQHCESDEGTESIKKRVGILSCDFFHKFPIVIAAVGHFPRNTYGDSYFGDIFGVEFLGNEGTEGYAWLNVSIRKDERNSMILIHTPQFSDAISDRYLDQIARRVVDFAHKHSINLLPEE